MYSISHTCRHRKSPGRGNAQDVAELNLPVDSQTYISAQLLKTIIHGAADMQAGTTVPVCYMTVGWGYYLSLRGPAVVV
jgi:hypothetical protein